METIGFDAHNHDHCIADGLATADAHCRDTGAQFTPARRRVLEILLERHRAMGAYEILDILRDEGMGSQPPVAYRALDFLAKQGFVHRIERLNAFVACAYPGEDHTPAFLICRACDRVAESPSNAQTGRLGEAARIAGFKVERAVVEAVGLCPACREKEDA